jgi:hypothetical protein
MKKVLSAVLALGFVFAVYSSAQAQSATDLNGIKITGDVSLFFGGLGKDNHSNALGPSVYHGYVPGIGIGTDEFQGTYIAQSQGMYQVNLNIIKTFENESSITIHLKGANDSVAPLKLGNFRPDVNDAAGPNGGQDNFFVNEVFYTLPLDLPAVGKTVIVAGYTGAPGSDNNLASSMGSFFTGDPTVIGTQGASANPYGVKVSITPMPLFTFTYGYFNQYFNNADPDKNTKNNLFEGAYNVAVLNITPIENGNYRIGYWESAHRAQQTRWNKTTRNGGINGDVDGGDYTLWNEEDKIYERYWRTQTTENPRGLFLSFDQMVGDFGFFARYGKRLDNTMEGGPFAAGQVIQVGTKISGAMWGRDNDTVFLGYGIAWLQDDILTSGNYVYEVVEDSDGNEHHDSKEIKPENHIEVNYSYSVLDGFRITPFFQYVWDIYTPVTSYTNNYDGTESIRSSKVDDFGYAGGVRLSFNF